MSHENEIIWNHFIGYLKRGAGVGGSSKPPEPPLDPPLKRTHTILVLITKTNAQTHLSLRCWNTETMGEIFQDYSWIQDFEADFPKKVSLKIMK